MRPTLSARRWTILPSPRTAPPYRTARGAPLPRPPLTHISHSFVSTVDFGRSIPNSSELMPASMALGTTTITVLSMVSMTVMETVSGGPGRLPGANVVVSRN